MTQAADAPDPLSARLQRYQDAPANLARALVARENREATTADLRAGLPKHLRRRLARLSKRASA